jgi:hypothetical protein
VVNGGLDDAIVVVGKVMAEAPSTVEGGVQGPGVNGLLYASGELVGFGVQIGDVALAEVVVGVALVLAYG